MRKAEAEFNPALYVTTRDDGNVDLSIRHRIMWMRSIYPGWRFTSDSYDIVALPDGEDNTIERFFAFGHVSVVNEQGVRIQTVPASTEIADSEFARDLFLDGVETILTFLGFDVENISEEQWKERYASDAFSPPQTKDNGPVKSAFASPPRSDEFSRESQEEVPQYAQVIELFERKALREPGVIPQGVLITKTNRERLFVQYCKSIVGQEWETANADEKKRIAASLRG